MSPTTTPPSPAKARARARAALNTLIELRDWLPTDEPAGSTRPFAIAAALRTIEQVDDDDPIWTAMTTLLPGIGYDEPRSESLRRASVDFLNALWDAEYEREHGETGTSLRTYERMRRAHTEIGETLDLIRLEA